MFKKAFLPTTGKQKTKAKQWLWFFGLYIISVLVLFGFSALIRLFVPQA